VDALYEAWSIRCLRDCPAVTHQTTDEPNLNDHMHHFLGLRTWGFGGPIATVGFMQSDLIERRQWLKISADPVCLVTRLRDLSSSRAHCLQREFLPTPTRALSWPLGHSRRLLGANANLLEWSITTETGSKTPSKCPPSVRRKRGERRTRIGCGVTTYYLLLLMDRGTRGYPPPRPPARRQGASERDELHRLFLCITYYYLYIW